MSPEVFVPPKFKPAVLADLAGKIKRAVNIPVIAVGRITAEAAVKIVSENKADLVAIGQGLLADPELPKKVSRGRPEDIVPCIVCQGCRDDTFTPGIVGIRCSVNPALGKEGESGITQARNKRKVLVVGGGPAGMEAAIIATLRGHRVVLWEEKHRLGGQLIPAAIAPHKDRINALIEYFETQLKRLKISVELGKTATGTLIEEAEPDVVILAIGVTPLVPSIPGMNDANVVFAEDVLEGKVDVGDKVVIIGGEMVGCETADLVAEKRRKVTVMRRGFDIAAKMGIHLKPFLMNRLSEKAVTFLVGVKYERITSESITITTKEGNRQTIEADTFVIAAGYEPNRTLFEEIKNKFHEIYMIGDCLKPDTIRKAISDGFTVGLSI